MNLSNGNLTSANLSNAILAGPNLIRANLAGANLAGARLTGTRLKDADLTNSLVGWTIFGRLDLSEVKGLDTVKHLGPSTIGIDTIYDSQGKISEHFLRSAGIPESFITYHASLLGKPIELYSCLISYSTKDQEFADRLYADLQAAGVRSWFAPEDLKIGDRFRDRIDESIRLHEKLLIILSENSVQSPWVASEVESAFERENCEKDRLVLFPVRIDHAVENTNQAWAAEIRRRRHIGDFSGWKNHDAYQNALKRLLRDLKPETKVE